MKRWGSALAIAALFLAGACHEAADTADSGIPPGAMSYAGYDDTGRLVVVGWIRLDVAMIQRSEGPLPSNEFAGEWELHTLVDPGKVGPQEGSGALAGTFVDGDVAVDLQPAGLNSNVRLFGTLTAGGVAPPKFSGTWQWETLLGIQAKGRFEAGG